MGFESIDRALLAQDDNAIWELFHENSKTSRNERHLTYPIHPSDETIVRAMQGLRRVKPYTVSPKVLLPDELPLYTRNLDDVLVGRESARAIAPGSIGLAQVAKVLRMSYGVTRDNAETDFPRPFRVIPSGGALYPLEIYLYAATVEDLESGLYHYDPEDHSLDALPLSAHRRHPAPLFVQQTLVEDAAAILFISAIFRRSTFKYGDRGYRFVLLEAGHLAQNAIIAGTEMDLAVTSIGGFFDREVDRYLGFDGLSESTVYALLLGRRARG